MKDRENSSFSYSYSAKEREEIKNIRDKYVLSEKGEEDGMTKLRRLDESVTSKATVIALVMGIIGALVMGTGMSLIMTDLAKAIHMSSDVALVVGIVLGVLGMAVASLAYPVYDLTVKKERERIAPEIIRLTDELMK